MKLDDCMKVFTFMTWILLLSSAHTLAVILSSESINSETTAQDSVVENVLPSPDLSSPSLSSSSSSSSSSSPPSSDSDSVVSDKLSDTPTNNNERTNLDKQEEIVIISKSDSSDSGDSAKSEHEIHSEKFQSNTEAVASQQQQPQTIESNENVKKIPEQKTKTQKISADNVEQNTAMPTSVPLKDSSKGIFVEPILVERIKSVLSDSKHDINHVQNQSTISSTDDGSTRPHGDSTTPSQTEVNKTATQNATTTIVDGSSSGTTGQQNELNLTVEENQIPVFSEWAQKRLEEAEKEVEQEAVNTSTMKKNATASKPPVLKLKNLKNYASPDCGAKIIAANSESSGTGYVLTKTRDEYLLSPCKSRIWFVVELCEAIQAERIDLANFELFSSSPKNFSVAVSGRFPTRDWMNVGKFIAKDERYIQSFDLHPHIFGKYVRVDVHSHYNSEHFCPISLFRVYGTSEIEAFETENRQHPIEDIDDDDDGDQESDATQKEKTNIFKSASDAVMSIVDTVKKAASFVKPNGNKTTDLDSQNALNAHQSERDCITPNHLINCENCSNAMAREVTALVECKQQLLNRLLSINIIRNSLYKSRICNSLIGSDLNINCSETTTDDFNATSSKQLTDLQVDYITHLFSLKYITAMCNLLAAGDRKLTWNSTIPISTETPINVTIVKKVDDQLLPSDQNNQRPAVQTTPSSSSTTQTDPVVDSSSQEQGSSETHKPPSEIVLTPADGMEKRQDSESNDKSNEDTDKDNVDPVGTVPTTGESNAPTPNNGEKNIFNVVESDDGSTEKATTQQSIPTTEDKLTPQTPHSEPATVRVESETPPPVIILPETTTPMPPTTITTDINDASDEQTQNGWTNTPQFGQKFQGESVFLRLSNRIKALERNMSLSGQYLEELSRRYKKQVEDLQSSFAKTLVNIEEQSRRNLERKQELFEQNQQLRNELDILTERIFSWKNILICCVCFTCVQIFIFHVILKIWGRKYGLDRSESSTITSETTANVESIPRKRKSGNVPMKFRRKSAEEKRERNPSESSSSAILRRPSTEALNITGTYTELLIDDSNTTTRSTSVDQAACGGGKPMQTNNKNTSGPDGYAAADISGYVKIEDLKDLYDKPNDEYEFYGPPQQQQQSPSKRTNESGSQVEDCASETSIDSSSESTPAAQTKKSKVLRNKYKNRRLSSPSFFKSPFSSGATAAAQSTGWEWHRSKKTKTSSQIFNNNKKSKSESPPQLKQNGINSSSNTNNNNNNSSSSIANAIAKHNKSVDNHVNRRGDSARTSISSSIDERKSSSGSFKRILKKIF